MERFAVLSFRTNEKDKQEFYEFCDVVGISPASAFNSFVKYVINNRKLPFEVSSVQENKE